MRWLELLWILPKKKSLVFHTFKKNTAHVAKQMLMGLEGGNHQWEKY